MAGRPKTWFLVILVNTAVLAVLVAATETAFKYVNIHKRSARAAASGPPKTKRAGTITKDYKVRGGPLGYRPKPGQVATARKTLGDEVLYDVEYTINGLQWRHTPAPADGAGRDAFAAFFGGSVTFGEGVSDHETLPYAFQALSREFRAYNFGFHGWGPQHMLAILESTDIDLGITQKRGMAFFTFIPGHMERLAGRFRKFRRTARHFPNYVLDGEGNAVRRGDFWSGRPLLSPLFRVLMRSHTVRYFKPDLGALTPWDYDLAAAVFRGACDRFAERYESLGCRVVLYDCDAEVAEALIGALEKRGVAYIDYARLFAGVDRNLFRIQGDGHPTPAAYRLVAEKLWADLNQN